MIEGDVPLRGGYVLLHRNVQRFRGGLVFKAHRLWVSLNTRLESNKEEEEEAGAPGYPGTKVVRSHQPAPLTPLSIAGGAPANALQEEAGGGRDDARDLPGP